MIITTFSISSNWRINVSTSTLFIFLVAVLGCQNGGEIGGEVSISEEKAERASQTEDTARMSSSTNTELEERTERQSEGELLRSPVQHTLLQSSSSNHVSSLSSSLDVSRQPRILGVGTLDRDGKDNLWSKSDLQFSLFNLEPNSDSLTAIPSVLDVPAITVPVEKYKRVYICGSTFWDVEHIPIQNSVYESFKPSEERPFDFVAVQPAVSYFALTDSLGDIEEASDSPFFNNTVAFSADISGDGLADIARTQYCCDEPSVNSEEEDVVCHSCSTTYHRDKSGAWVVTNRIPPC